ncbi:MAG: branched-chain amino acid ABC transporter permease [Bacillota bacterium]
MKVKTAPGSDYLKLSYLACGAGFVILLVLPVLAPNLTAYGIGLLMYVTMAVGYNLQGGYLGDLSFGHAVFFGLGGYAAALLVEHNLINWAPLNVFIGACFAAFFAAVIGLPFLRLKGFYFSIGTLGLSSLLLLVVKNVLSPITKGEAGLMIPPPQPYHIEIFYYSILGIAALSGLVSFLIVRSRCGLAFTAIRDNPEAAAALGINVTACRVTGFALSAFIVGTVGGFYAYYASYINPEGVFAGTISFEVLIMVFLGGAGTLLGPFMGAAAFYVFEEVGRTYIGPGFYLLPALLLILVFLKMPNGIMGLIDGRNKKAVEKVSEVNRAC